MIDLYGEVADNALHGGHNGSTRWMYRIFMNFGQVVKLQSVIELMFQEGCFQFVDDTI